MDRTDLTELVARHVDAIGRETDLLVAAAEAAGPDAPVPSCPGWTVRDLVRHTGGFHRWAHAHVSEQRTSVLPEADEAAVMNTWPADPADFAALVAWFRAGSSALVETMTAADPELDCWHFMPAPSGTVFWARRQAHETGVHRADAQLAAARLDPFPADHAADGVDELVRGFMATRSRRLRADPPVTLALLATDADAGWHVTIRPDAVEVVDKGADAACTVRGTASDLYLFVWNRVGTDTLDVAGDPAVLELWRTRARVG
ncbi:MAG: maleylpyruvate isomerase family mycothiol-dependent enzyme [Streptosporangiales bacterium]|nr:maleylpyruvate isomerase family mycothiol-dependent enzyme [Streptosporangiales bacterium]MBO0890301.1 maleylpyruvate isomerase family mycothiol-dependent enzyme [Acidothermales bacterium]